MGILFWKNKRTIAHKKKKKNIQSVVAKVPAKLIVSGEHAVVYNHCAVVCCIKRFLKVKIKKLNYQVIIINDGKDKIHINLNDFSIEKKNNNVLLEIIRRFFDTTKTPLFGMEINIKNDIPIGYGFGSSSALICGIVFCLNLLFETKCKVNKLIELSTNIENIFHGKSSGVDIETITRGGVLYANSGNVKKISHQLDEVWIVNTGRPSFSTKNVVLEVAEHFSHSKIWDEFYGVTEDISEIMQTKELLNQKIAHNESLLEKIGVVKTEIKSMLEELKQYSIYGKVCGAGTIASKEYKGGNGVVAFFQQLDKEQIDVLKKVCKKHNFKLQKVYISNAGLTTKSK